MKLTKKKAKKRKKGREGYNQFFFFEMLMVNVKDFEWKTNLLKMLVNSDCHEKLDVTKINHPCYCLFWSLQLFFKKFLRQDEEARYLLGCLGHKLLKTAVERGLPFINLFLRGESLKTREMKDTRIVFLYYLFTDVTQIKAIRMK